MYEIRVTDSRIPAYRVVKGVTKSEADAKAAVLRAVWEERWQKKEAAAKAREVKSQRYNVQLTGKVQAQDLTAEVQATIKSLESILIDGQRERKLVWSDLNDTTRFISRSPSKPTPVTLPPSPAAESFHPAFSFLDKLIASRRKTKTDEASQRHSVATAAWVEEVDGLKKLIAEEQEEHTRALSRWQKEKEEFASNQAAQYASVETLRVAYLAADKNSVEYFISEAITRSEYPDGLSQGFDHSFDPTSGILIMDFELPNQDFLPKYREVKYIASRSELQYVSVTESWRKTTYDNILYQTALRTISRIFSVDQPCIIRSVVFNGWVRSIDKATGAEAHGCILSVQAGRDEFMCLDLGRVEAKACFKSLKGVSSSKLIELTPIRPILRLDREDTRFIQPYNVAESLDERTNLAAMDWQDFENLIREIFEKEFSRDGGEVKITRASRDGGVDAVAFDPDPLRGGKMVIQAKRYTNTVGVSAVRDLYGTVQHEGAMKGILVTTATFGADAYEFARDKPLTLLSGAELLGMLEKHGHRAKIDLAAARLLREKP
jgi:restriction system protein